MALVPPCRSCEVSVKNLFSKQSSACGLALFIGCMNSSDPKQDFLPGVERDLDLLRETFRQIGFDTIEMRDPDGEDIIAVLKTIADNFSGRYESLVVTFSGHGDQTRLFSKSKPLDLMSDVVQPLISINPLVPKLFFVDACRGDKIDGVGVVYKIDKSARIKARGGEEEIRLPRNGNYLLAYSTLPGMKSFEDYSRGSFWMNILCEKLLNGGGKSIQDLLTIVNQELILQCNDRNHCLQQPIFMSCLNQVICFHPNNVSDNIYLRIPEKESAKMLTFNDTDTETSRAQLIDIPIKLPSDIHAGYYRGALNSFKQKGIIEEGGEIELRKNPYNEQQYKCTIKAKLINKCHVTAESEYRPKKLAEEKACEDFFNKVQLYLTNLKVTTESSSSADQLALPPLPTAQPALPSARPAPQTAAQLNTPAGKSPTASKTAKSRLKEYCDKKWRGSEVTYSSEHNGSDFTATVTLPDGKYLTGPVKPNKKEAETSAAGMMLYQLDI